MLDGSFDFSTIEADLTEKMTALSQNDTGNLFTATFNSDGKIVYNGTNQAPRTRKPTTKGPSTAKPDKIISYTLDDVFKVLIDSNNIIYLLKLFGDDKSQLSNSEKETLKYFFDDINDQVTLQINL